MKFMSSISISLGVGLISLSVFSNYVASMYLHLEEMMIEWELISLGSSSISLVFIFDFMSLYFISLVSLVAGSVMLFSTSYMSKEVYFGRFIGLVLSFIMSMFLLILSPNIISLLLGWDGLGVTSYLLVIFYQSSKSYNAGMITALTNRLGDVGLLISIGMMLSFGNWTFLYSTSSSKMLPAVLLMIIITSACTKSAQMPFSAWLPAAMAAPTPVSALVHSSTLVTAGVYVLIRMNIYLVESKSAEILMVVGTLTMMMAGLAAMLEMDMKKIIALSTLSQLGIMMMILGAGNPILAYFHLLSHAFFKAMLFMCAGMIIHNMKDYQDIRKMGLGQMSLPITMSIMMVANLSLCGLPFLSGFYSKDIILEMMLMKGLSLFMLFLMIVATFLTVAYSCRLSFLVGINMSKSETFFSMLEGDKMMLSGMAVLLPFSILGGMMLSWNIFSSMSMIFLPAWMKSIILLCIMSAILFMYYYYLSSSFLSSSLLSWFLGNMWFMPLTFSLSTLNNSLMFSKSFSKIVEMSWAELILFKKVLSVFDLSLSNSYLDFLSYTYIMQVVEIATVVFIFYLIL
uniref:NADH-ubiquinone oxidoreductase chain 5 n=1 Tax=Calanus hyperboreus TaxID=114069 RepID=K7QLW3_CALHY|nr:NADH dehydrogenase subunit 5 [Calanus hyperboreus]AFU88797.1 NADH dehydrogenase subunit 5 [Calanus hyperboreus]